ncbi:MAG: AAA family ATPase, partial [Desulfatiglandales bacterium]
GRVYDGSMVGRSEANLRNALKTAESISPAILFIDEVHMLVGAGSAGSSVDAANILKPALEVVREIEANLEKPSDEQIQEELKKKFKKA